MRPFAADLGALCRLRALLPTAHPSLCSFYTHWLPDDSRLTTLSNATTGTLSCSLVDFGLGPDVTESVVQLGRPLYYSYCPFGNGLAIFHLSMSMLRLVDIELDQGAEVQIEGYSSLGDFAAPVWTKRNKIVLVMTADNSDEQSLILVDAPPLSAAKPVPPRASSRKTKAQSILRTFAALMRGNTYVQNGVIVRTRIR